MGKHIFIMLVLSFLHSCISDSGNICTSTDSNVNCLAHADAPALLVGSYTLFKVQLFYENGTTLILDSTVVNGTYSVSSNGKYSQIIYIEESMNSVSGKFLEVKEIGTHKWQIQSYFEPKSEIGVFEVKNDTMSYTLVVPKSTDPSGIGFTEIDHYKKVF